MSTNNSTENISEPWSTPANLPENDKIIWDYIASRSYRLKYWKILRNALADGTYNQYNLNSVLAGELEFEVVRVKNKLPGYYQDYDMEFLENLAGVSMCWRPPGVPFIHKPPTEDEIVEAVANAMKKMAAEADASEIE
jgi:hypothetical protein